jgi:hypothetical protein
MKVIRRPPPPHAATLALAPIFLDFPLRHIQHVGLGVIMISKPLHIVFKWLSGSGGGGEGRARTNRDVKKNENAELSN